MGAMRVRLEWVCDILPQRPRLDQEITRYLGLDVGSTLTSIDGTLLKTRQMRVHWEDTRKTQECAMTAVVHTTLPRPVPTGSSVKDTIAGVHDYEDLHHARIVAILNFRAIHESLVYRYQQLSNRGK